MAPSDSADQTYEFGRFSINTTERVLLRDGEAVALTPKAVATLLVLVENSGRILEKEELMRLLWPGQFVEESNLTHHISVLRKTLGEGEDGRPFIETVPRRGYRFAAGVSEVGREASLPMRSLAVLPFRSLAMAQRDEALEMGMADTLITKLSQIRQLAVRPTSAVRRFTDPEQDAVKAGRELRAEVVLEGNIQRGGDNVRVTVQFIRVKDGHTLWAEKFDEQFTNIFTLQDAIAEQVAGALSIKLLGDEEKQLRKHYTESTKAYELYLQGRHELLSQYTEKSWKRAVKYFEEAINEDPSYALAFVGLAYSHLLASNLFLPPKEASAAAEEWVREALALDETLAEAHTCLAGITFAHHWGFTGAEREIKRAIELKPKYADAHWLYGIFLASMGRFVEGLAEMKLARELDPLSLPISIDVGWLYYLSHRYMEAREELERALEIDPNNPEALVYLARTHVATGEFSQAIALLEKPGWMDEPLWILAMLGYTLAVSGRGDEALRTAEQLIEMSEHRYVSPLHIALVFTGLGRTDQAISWLEKAYEERADLLVTLNVDPLFDSLRSDPQFTSLLQRIGFVARA
jgi:DNA-binding winged helix-turn-helix (wHTH) protein/Tfp pilus assembly protein PilF